MQLQLSNTGWVGVSNGLNGLPIYNAQGDVIGDTDTGLDTSNPQSMVTALNSEALYLTNLWRQARGLPPVNPSLSAPTVNVGLSPEAKQMLMVGGIGLVALLLLRRRG